MFLEHQTKEYKESLERYIPIYIIGKIINKDSINLYNKEYGTNIQTYEGFFDNMGKKGLEAVSYYDNFFSGFDIPEWKFQF